MWRDSAGIWQSWDSSEKALIQCTSWGQAQHPCSGPNTEWFLSPRKKPLKTQGVWYPVQAAHPRHHAPCCLISAQGSQWTADPAPQEDPQGPSPCFCPKQNLQRSLLNYVFTIRITRYFRNLAGSVSEQMLSSWGWGQFFRIDGQ